LEIKSINIEKAASVSYCKFVPFEFDKMSDGSSASAVCNANETKVALEKCGISSSGIDGGICCCPLSGSSVCLNDKYTTGNTINYSQMDVGFSLPSACDKYKNAPYLLEYGGIISSDANVGKNILLAIAASESGCTENAESAAGACGIVQLMPGTAGMDCATLKANPQESFRRAAQYIRNNYSSHQNVLKKIFSGYNGGYATKTSDGKLGPLAASNDCPGVSAFECCIDPGGLKETQNYVYNCLGYYNSL